MTHTGIRCTPVELAELRRLAEEASNMPVIKLTSSMPDLSSLAWDRCRKRVHEIALAHGLPEIEGYYGVGYDGEFVKL
jgi:hypothetical protein